MNYADIKCKTMILRKYVINQKKFKIFLLLINFILIILTLIFLKFDKPIAEQIAVNSKVIQQRQQKQHEQYDTNELQQNDENTNDEKHLQVRQSPLIPEKYNDYNVKQRLMKEKIDYLTQSKTNGNANEENIKITELKKNSQHIHIFYNLPVSWYKDQDSSLGLSQQQRLHSVETLKMPLEFDSNITFLSSTASSSFNNQNDKNANKLSNINLPNANLSPSQRTSNKLLLDTAYYPYRGPYKQDNRILREHLTSIHAAGIGVLVIELNSSNTIRKKLLDKLFKLVPKYNISITFEINVNRNRTVEYLNDIINSLKSYFIKYGTYKVYSIKKQKQLPLIYVIDAYKIQIPDNRPTSCVKKLLNFDDSHFDDIILIAHIRVKEHADAVKKLCFDGFYSKLPSNGAFYASTWKNWGYLSRFAKLNKMIFIPTVGPGYMQKKIPRHGGFEKDRSNGKYYGFAWSTAIAQNPQFISIASYNNWRDGTQIEEATVKSGYLNYLPGKPTKYMHLTAHWANNYIKTKENSQKTFNRCHNLFNNTIC